MTEAAFDRLLRRLSEADVEFVLIGGLAVIVIASDIENLKRVAAVAAAANGHVQTGESFLSSQPSIAGRLASGEQVAIETELGRLDVVQGLDGVPGFEELHAQLDRAPS